MADVANKIQNSLLDAINYLVENKVSTIERDKTVIASIVSPVDTTRGSYKVSYNNGYFTAFAQGNATYKKNQDVYVLIPLGDFSQVKTIIGKASAGTDEENQVFVSSLINDYNQVGGNSISNSGKVKFKFPVGLSSYYAQDACLFYTAFPTTEEKKDPLLVINENALGTYAPDCTGFLLQATFNTSLPRQHRITGSGNYGVQCVVAFKDLDSYVDDLAKVTDAEDGETVLQYNIRKGNIVKRPYVLDTSVMNGNPFLYPSPTVQYVISEFDGKNYLYVDSIIGFSNGFIEQDDLQMAEKSFNEGGWGDDIFINDITLVPLRKIEATNGDYSLRIDTPYGAVFDNIGDEQSLPIRATVTYKINLDVSASTVFYWFRKDSSVNSKSEYYNVYGGSGWAYMEDKGHNRNCSFLASETHGYKNDYMIAAVYQDQIILKDYFTIYNQAYKSVIEITSDLGTTFSFDRGIPTLTCTVDDSNLTPGKYRYTWSSQSTSGLVTTYTKSIAELEEEIEQARQDAESGVITGGAYLRIKSANNAVINELQGVEWEGNTLKLPVKSISSQIIVSCAVYRTTDLTSDNPTYYYFGEADIILQNKDIADPTDYSIVIVNGDQVFQYDETGVSPANERNDTPQIIMPLEVRFYDPAGLEVNQNTYSVKWLFPTKDSMIVNPDGKDEMLPIEINPSTGVREIFNNAIYPLDIVDNYDYISVKNQVTAIVTYNGETFTKESNLLFTKVGENGTNGTDYVARIVAEPPAGTKLEGLPFVFRPPITDENDEQQKKLFYWNVYGNGEYAPASSLSILNNEVGYVDGSLFSFKLYNKDQAISNYKTIWSADRSRVFSIKKIEEKGVNKDRYQLSVADSELKVSNKNPILTNLIIKGQAYLHSTSNSPQSRTPESKYYYGFYGIPFFKTYNYNRLKVSLDKDYCLRSVLYNANGYNPLWNKNQGLFINIENLDSNLKSIENELHGLLVKSDLRNYAADIKAAIDYLDKNFQISNLDFYFTALGGYTVNDKNVPNENFPNFEISSTKNGTFVNNLEGTIPEVKEQAISLIESYIRNLNKYNEEQLVEINALLDNYRRDFNFDLCAKLIHIYIDPEDEYNGLYTNNNIKIVVTKTDNKGKVTETTETLLEGYYPIYMSLNTYGLQSLNDWDGNTLEINEDDGYILAPQIGAGKKVGDNNTFTGIVMGEVKAYDTNKDGKLVERSETGLFGYSQGKQSIFLDSETGDAIFGLPSENGLQKDKDYREGRIELKPGGTSNIAGWRIGANSLYNFHLPTKYIDEMKNEPQQYPNFGGEDGSIYVSQGKDKDGNDKGKSTKDAYSDKLYDGIRLDNQFDKKIVDKAEVSAHPKASGIILGSNPAFLSVKGKELEKGEISNSPDAIAREGDSFEVELDPNKRSIFTIYRIFEKKYTDKDGNPYTRFHRHNIVGINSDGQFYSNAVENGESSMSLGYVSGFTETASVDNPLYMGVKFGLNNSSGNSSNLVKFFYDTREIERNDYSTMPLYISGGMGGEETGSNEYIRPMNLYGKSVNIYAENDTRTKDGKISGTKLELAYKNANFGLFDLRNNNYFPTEGIQFKYGTENFSIMASQKMIIKGIKANKTDDFFHAQISTDERDKNGVQIGGFRLDTTESTVISLQKLDERINSSANIITENYSLRHSPVEYTRNEQKVLDTVGFNFNGNKISIGGNNNYLLIANNEASKLKLEKDFFIDNQNGNNQFKVDTGGNIALWGHGSNQSAYLTLTPSSANSASFNLQAGIAQIRGYHVLVSPTLSRAKIEIHGDTIIGGWVETQDKVNEFGINCTKGMIRAVDYNFHQDGGQKPITKIETHYEKNEAVWDYAWLGRPVNTNYGSTMFENLYYNVTQLAKRLKDADEGLSSRIGGVEGRASDLENRAGDLERRAGNLEGSVTTLSKDIAKIYGILSSHTHGLHTASGGSNVIGYMSSTNHQIGNDTYFPNGLLGHTSGGEWTD